MNKEDFNNWAVAVVMHNEQSKEDNLAFVKQVEEHDKEAAALARKTIMASSDLAEHLKKVLAKG